MPSKKKKKTPAAAVDGAEPATAPAAAPAADYKEIESLAVAAKKYRDKADFSRAGLLYKQVTLKGESLLKKGTSNDTDALHRICGDAFLSLGTHCDRPDDLEEATADDKKRTEEHYVHALQHFQQVGNKPADGALPLHFALAIGGLAEVRSFSLEVEEATPFKLERASIKDAQAVTLDFATATPFQLLAHALAKVEEAITKLKIQLLLSLRDQTNMAVAQAEAAEGLQNAYEAPGHFIGIANPLHAGERLAIAEHVIGMADGFSGEEGKLLKAEATLECGESMADIIESWVDEQEGTDHREALEKVRETDVFVAALDHLRDAIKQYTAAQEQEDEEDQDRVKYQLGHAMFRLEQLLPEESDERTDLMKELEKLDLVDEDWEDEDGSDAKSDEAALADEQKAHSQHKGHVHGKGCKH